MRHFIVESQFQEFVDSLTDSEVSMIAVWGDDPYFTGFEDCLKSVIEMRKEHPRRLKKDMPSIEKLANFERTHKIKLYELINYPGRRYEGKTIAMSDSVLLPVGIDENGEFIDVHLGMREQFVLHMRDSQYSGSWEKSKHEILYGKMAGQADHLHTVDNLKKYEEQHKVNLGALLRKIVRLRRAKKINKNEIKGERK
jgi:hypothetical protein